jgi:HEAT repeat protein
MSDTPTSRELRGLSRAVDDLFSGRDPDPAELPPPLGAPRPEVEGLLDEGVEAVGWAGETHSRESGDSPTGVASSAPSPADPSGGSAGPGDRGRGTALRKALAAFVAAPEAKRPAMATTVRREVERLRDQRDGAALADAVERLVRARGDDPGALALAGEMVSPGVAGVFTARIREAARDEARQEELVGVIRRLGDEMVRAVADALTTTEDRSERRALFNALVALAPDNQEIVVELLDDRRWFVVRNAVQVVGETGGPDAVQHLTGALGHDHPTVRREALLALARIGGEDAGMLILSMVQDPSPEVRSAAALAMGELAPGQLEVERAQRPLLAQLDEEEDADIVVQIMRALGALGDPGSVPALEKRAVAGFFSRRPAEIRVAAYRALAAIGTPHARRLVEAATEDRDPEIRGVARYLVKQFRELSVRDGEENSSGAARGTADTGENGAGGAEGDASTYR